MRNMRPISAGIEQHIHTHIEKRAPTDDSVRLLREMEQKAEEQWTHSMRLDNTFLDGIVHYRQDFHRCMAIYHVIIKVNGKEVVVDKAIPFDWCTDSETVMAMLTAEVAKALAISVVCPAVNKLIRRDNE